MPQKVRLIIKGMVQGVGFRYFTREKANELQLSGWVRNTEEGHVECVAEGSEDKIKAFLQWCWVGSPSARVTAVETISDEKISGASLASFEIRRDG